MSGRGLKTWVNMSDHTGTRTAFPLGGQKHRPRQGLCLIGPEGKHSRSPGMKLIWRGHAAAAIGAMLDRVPALQRDSVQDYMADDNDKARFERLLIAAQSDTEGALPGVMHTTFRDTSGAKLSTEIFYVRFTTLDGRCRFLAGIQESAGYDCRPIVVPVCPRQIGLFSAGGHHGSPN